MKKILLIVLIISSCIYSKNIILRGKISDKKNNQPLAYANVAVLNSNMGTSSNKLGEFELRLENKKYTLIASYIGFISDTIEVDVSKVNFVEFGLQEVALELSEVKVTPGYNPALRIIRNASKTREERNSKIQDYDFTAYTKGVIKSANDFSAGGNSVSLGIGTIEDTMFIQGILENQSRGYFKKPDNYKEEIVAQKQTANFPSSINLLTGNRIVQNFYNNDIQFFGKQLPNPVDENSMDYYYYYLEDSTAIDNQKVYKIFFSPDDEADPGFVGDLYVTDKTYDLIKVDVGLNSAANPAGIFDTVRVFQQFVKSSKNLYMPVDYRLFVEGSYLGLITFGFEVNTIMYDYNINTTINDDFFDYTILKVLPEADKKDSVYWSGIQTVPITKEEKTAYTKIDSIESVPVTFWERFSFFSGRISLDDNFSITGPLDLYSYDKVAGHALHYGLFYSGLDNRRLYGRNEMSYGFSDKKFKYNLNNTYLFGDYRSYSANLIIKDNQETLFGSSIQYNNLTSTVAGLFLKYDFRDYFYRKGVELNFYGNVLPFLDMGLGYLSYQDKSAENNSDFSFFYKDENFNVNPAINEVNINALKVSFTLDFRKFIEDGYFRRRVNRSGNNIVFRGSAEIANNNILPASTDFKKYNFNISGRLESYRNTNIRYQTNYTYIDGKVPVQYMAVLPGNISSGGKDNSFRTLKTAEVFGDESASLFLTYNFNDELFKILNIPYLKDLRLMTSVYMNSALIDTRDENKNYNTIFSRSYRSPFYETGFSLGYQGFPLVFEFTWKLNYKGSNDFVFGVNTFAL